MNMARRWLPRGGREMSRWPTTYSARDVKTKGVLVGVAGPKRRIQERLADFPDLTTTIEDMFSAHDKIVTRLVWREPIPAHMGCQGNGQASVGPGLCRLAFRRRRGGGNLNDTGSVWASKADRILP